MNGNWTRTKIRNAGAGATYANGLFKPFFMLTFMLFSLLILTAPSFAQSPPDYQSVSGQFAREWLNNSGIGHQMPLSSGTAAIGSIAGEGSGINSSAAGSNASSDSSNASDLWSWGSAPRGSSIVDGELVTDPNYLRSLYNLSSNWLAESYTDSATGLPVEVYSDPVTGKTYYVLLSPTSGKAIFTYHTYTDSGTGRLVYVYVDPSTGKEVTSSTAPTEIILTLAASQTEGGQTSSSQNEPWIRL